MINWSWGHPESESDFFTPMPPPAIYWLEAQLRAKNAKRSGVIVRYLHNVADKALIRELRAGHSYYQATMLAVSRLSFIGALAIFLIWSMVSLGVYLLLTWALDTIPWFYYLFIAGEITLVVNWLLRRFFFKPKCNHQPQEVKEIYNGQPVYRVVCSECGETIR